MNNGIRILQTGLVAVLFAGVAGAQDTWLSHTPMRPLPVAHNRPLPDGPVHYVDAKRGNDANDGSKVNPWKTVNHALKQLRPGDTLCLRSGVYYENVKVNVQGAAARPVTIQSYPGELAVLDAGLRDFFENPAEAWEPFPAGAEGEFRSVKKYRQLRPLEYLRRQVYTMGNFGDSMVPLHGYQHIVDLRSDNELWTLADKLSGAEGIYVGPGVWYDGWLFEIVPAPDHQPRTLGGFRVYIRLAHTNVKGLGANNYSGVTDPRQAPLVICGSRPALAFEGAGHVTVRDLVVRGSRQNTVEVIGSHDITLDNVTVYGGAPALYVAQTGRLRLLHSAIRGVAAPWSTRASMKYRGISPYLVRCSGVVPVNHDFEFAHCEFTDGHDGVYVGTVQGMKFHHNLVDNFNDDGIYLNAQGVGGNIHIVQNRITRCLSSIAFSGRWSPGDGVWIARNVFDLRRPVWGSRPREAAGAIQTRPCRVWGEHGSPTWEPLYIYHNTIVNPGNAFRSYYLGGYGGHTRDTTRRMFNNIYVQAEGMPGLHFPPAAADVEADHNLLWAAAEGPGFKGDFFAEWRSSKEFDESRQRYAPGWAAHDIFADPGFLKFDSDWRRPLDLRLSENSPAVDAGTEIPETWPDPLRAKDTDAPDIGALPLAASPWRVGVRGRMDVFGAHIEEEP